jgi:hypothetical protein
VRPVQRGRHRVGAVGLTQSGDRGDVGAQSGGTGRRGGAQERLRFIAEREERLLDARLHDR